MTRPDPVATADLVATWRERTKDVGRTRPHGVLAAGDALAKALEDTAAERDRARRALGVAWTLLTHDFLSPEERSDYRDMVREAVEELP